MHAHRFTTISFASDGVDVDFVALCTLALLVEVVEGTAQALVENGATVDSEGIILADGETRGEKGILLYGIIELELGVGHDAASAAVLVGENTAFKSDDGSCSAHSSGLSLQRRSMKLCHHCEDYGRLTLSNWPGALEIFRGWMTKVPSKSDEHPSGF